MIRLTSSVAMFAAALCVFAAPASAQTPGTPKPEPSAQQPQGRIRTSEETKRESVQGAATAPLRDLNVVRVKIPQVLLQALADPYARPPRSWKCSQLIAMVRPLDDVLGPDIDQIPPGDENLMDRGSKTALGAAADLASDAIPFRGWVRKLTGAEKHDRLVLSAIIAGNVRRAYLKGLGEMRGCNPPATPSHERAGSVAVKAPGSIFTRRSGPAAPQTPPGNPPPARK